MTFLAGQRRTLRALLAQVRPHWRQDRGLPGRIETLLRRDRRLGSRDRRLYREMIYTALRFLPWVEPLLEADPDLADQTLAWLAADLPATRAYRAELTRGWPACPPGAAAKAAVLEQRLQHPLPSLLPDWAHQEAPGAFAPDDYEALARRAPLWLRLVPDRAETAVADWEARGWQWRVSDLLDGAVALLGEVDVSTTAAYQAGAFEVQDLGSQLILAAASPQPGEKWLDACAGAGGKTLQLAQLVGATGRVDVHDVRPRALAELARRAARAGYAERIHPMPRGATGYDRVLVDAPCSGSGTWRRSPHLKWVTTTAELESHHRRQVGLLAHFAPAVRPGGELVYATCSLCPRENEATVRAFLAGHPDFKPLPPPRAFTSRPAGDGFQFWPAAHDGDGFFAAILQRR